MQVRDAEDLTLESFEAVVWDGLPLSIHPDLLLQVDRCRAAMLNALASGQSVYGVNTGMGYLAGVGLDPEQQQDHQANLLLGRAVGGPPFLDRDEVRAVLLARLVGFLQGHAGVSAELCRFLVERLNDDFLPAVPRTGIGCAGDIIPLSHAFQTFLGVGQVLSDGGASLDAGAALDARGAAPYRPEIKEGIALLAGAPGELALAIVHRRAVAALTRQLLVGAACAIDALRAPLSPYGPAIAHLARDDVLSGLLQTLGRLLDGSSPDRMTGQAPISFRVIPQVHTYLQRVLGRLEETIHRALLADTDSPALVDGQFVTSGAFHAIELVAGMDTLGVALVGAAELACQHIHRLLDGRFSGLPDQLTASPGPQAGLVVVHKRAVATVAELRRLAVPSTLGLIDTSMGQEDAVTFGFNAAEKLRQIEALIREVLACQLLVVRQAWALRGTGIAAGLAEYAALLARTIAPVDRDRPLGPDITVLQGMLGEGKFV